MAGGKLTTHVLDTTSGKPGAGLRIDLFRLSGEDRTALKSVLTNADGRCDESLLSGDDFGLGEYELVFHVGGYFAGTGQSLPSPAFLDKVPVRFGVSDAGRHYHVPLLISPFGYSTYRGS